MTTIDERQGFTVPGEPGKLLESNRKSLRQSTFAKSSRQNSDECDADLCRRQKPIRIGRKIEGGLSSAVAFVCELLKPRFAGRDHGHFSHDEDAVEENQ